MTRKGKRKTQKRLAAPKYWPINRKESKFTVASLPGPHPTENAIPLMIIIRDILKLCKTRKEANYIITEGNIKIDGKIRRNPYHYLGLMDVLEIVPLKKYYRLLPIPLHGLTVQEIDEDEKDFKLCRIENKTILKKGKIQLNLHDGRNIIMPVKDPENPEEDVYKTQDVLKISLPDQEILEHLEFDENVLSIIVAGKNLGYVGKVLEIERREGPYQNIIRVQSKDEELQTALEYAFMVGVDKPIITLPTS
ncbi:MAG: 30S ribosomal protein S4e [Candidatus Lokiarchaeota archaeon]|nr:30S ribosomal protein S4e [Candidatus Lokiarchaeota archaeon]